MKKRKYVSWKIRESESEILNEWLDNQESIQHSLSSIVFHMMDRYGTRDVMSHDIQKMMHQEARSNNDEATTVDILEPVKDEEVTINPEKDTVIKNKKWNEVNRNSVFGGN